MSDALINSVSTRWVRLGVLLNAPAARRTPDLEQLLLDTARVASANTRLFVAAASWLALCGDYVAKHRLARMIRDDLEPSCRPVLGLLLDYAAGHTRSNACRFNLAIKACGRPADARPLSDIEHGNPAFSKMAFDRASKLSRKWGRWFSEFRLRDEILRPLEWIAAHNPSLADRALTGGDLLATALAQLQADVGPAASEAALARRCGASRPAIRDAVRRLQLAGRIRCIRIGRSNGFSLVDWTRHC